MRRVQAAIEAVRAGIAAITIPDRRQGEFERRREPLTEFLEEDGRRVERLVAKCGSCGQSVRGRRVIRFTKDELERWLILDRDAVRLGRLATLSRILTAIVGAGLVVWVFVASRLLGVAVVAGLLGSGGMLVFTVLRIRQEEKGRDQYRAKILRRHGDMKPKQVGLVEGYQPYVIFPTP